MDGERRGGHLAPVIIGRRDGAFSAQEGGRHPAILEQRLFLMRDNMRYRPPTCHYDLRHNPARCVEPRKAAPRDARRRLENRDTRGRGRTAEAVALGGSCTSPATQANTPRERRDFGGGHRCCWPPRGCLAPPRRLAWSTPTRKFTACRTSSARMRRRHLLKRRARCSPRSASLCRIIPTARSKRQPESPRSTRSKQRPTAYSSSTQM